MLPVAAGQGRLRLRSGRSSVESQCPLWPKWAYRYKETGVPKDAALGYFAPFPSSSRDRSWNSSMRQTWPAQRAGSRCGIDALPRASSQRLPIASSCDFQQLLASLKSGRGVRVRGAIS
jgi:hypothetical protein